MSMALCQQWAVGEANGQVDSRRQRYGASHRGRHAGPGSGVCRYPCRYGPITRHQP
ncbi:hypothetical protein K0M31_006183 [Melipona bicolor]|uniref:Uncharacterized protein n=1 Tax=Melipona bicolor TaxID=60889 RepID=A0AA40KLJ2_9HYME|nr:hypothetical protein K0M31_006183 [Melipona bicolor]